QMPVPARYLITKSGQEPNYLGLHGLIDRGKGTIISFRTSHSIVFSICSTSLLSWKGLVAMIKQVDEEPLVSRKELEEIIDQIEGLKPYRGYLKRRWLHMVIWWHNRSVNAKWKYNTLRAILIIGGVLIPVLS